MTKLFVIPGHGAGDPGCCAYGFSEAERVRALASRIKALGGDNVTLADFRRDYYQDNGIGRGDYPAGHEIIELHMDGASPAARGGHVIIASGLTPDRYDRALQAFIGSFMAGRSNTLVARSDLANPNRAKARGASYRLLECGFISNRGDLDKFNNQTDELAAGILRAFDIETGVRDMAKPNEMWEYLWAGDSTHKNCYDKLHDVYCQMARTDDVTGDKSEGNFYDRLCWVDKRIRELYPVLVAQSETIKVLAQSQGADPERISKTVEDAVKAKLDSMSFEIKTK